MVKIVSAFKDKPHLHTTWWAMRLGLASLLVPPFLGIFASVIRPMLDRVSVNSEAPGIAMGFGGVVFDLVLSISALLVSIKVYKQGERSWVLWLGFVPAVLIALFWIFMIAGELVFPH